MSSHPSALSCVDSGVGTQAATRANTTKQHVEKSVVRLVYSPPASRKLDWLGAKEDVEQTLCAIVDEEATIETLCEELKMNAYDL